MKENFVVVLLRDSFEKQSTEFGAIFECVFCLWGAAISISKIYDLHTCHGRSL